MDVVRDLGALRAPDRPAVVTVGNFDGVHRGHQSLVRLVRERAALHGATTVAVTFDPHPQALLHPDRAPVPLTSMPERIELLAATGLDRLVVLPFTRELAAVTAEDFVTDYLLGRLGAREIYVGSNFGFGRGKAGNTELLSRMASAHGFLFGVVDSVTDAGEMISSTRIRGLVERAELDAAREELSRPYQLWGRVVPGDGRGRTLGFPTANVRGDKPLLVGNGVYAVTVAHRDQVHGGALNAGRRPTFPGASPTVEVHLLDYDGGDLTGEEIRVSFWAWLREERAFPSVDALKSQIGHDVRGARRALKEREAMP